MVLLKLCKNKKSQTFVGMLIFLDPCFEFESAACCKKKIRKMSTQQSFGSSYFCQGFNNIWIWQLPFFIVTMNLCKFIPKRDLVPMEEPQNKNVGQPNILVSFPDSNKISLITYQTDVNVSRMSPKLLRT